MNVVLSLFPDTAGDKAVLDRHNTGLFLKIAQDQSKAAKILKLRQLLWMLCRCSQPKVL
jgi:hypothetical protein